MSYVTAYHFFLKIMRRSILIFLKDCRKNQAFKKPGSCLALFSSAGNPGIQALAFPFLPLPSGKGSGIEHILVQPVEGLLHPGEGQGQVHADMAGAVERPSVLPGHAHVPSGLLQFVDGLSMGLAPLRAVQEQHVSALGPGDLHAVEMLRDVGAGKVHIAGDRLAQLVHPLVALRFISADQGVHGKDIHAVVMGEGGLLVHPVPEGFIINDMVAAHQACQVEGLGGRVDRHGAVPGILADALGGHMLIPFQDDVRPDLIGDHHHVVLAAQLHELLHLPAFPDPATGIVGGTEYGGVDSVLRDFLLHVRKVHAVCTVLVQNQRAVDDSVAIVAQGPGKAHIGGGVEEHIVPSGAEHVQGADHAAQHAVLIADAFPGEACGAVAGLLPPDDRVQVFLPGGEVAEMRLLCAGDDRFLHRGDGGEVHVRHPHGDGVEALLGGTGGGAVAQGVNGDGVHAFAVQD